MAPLLALGLVAGGCLDDAPQDVRWEVVGDALLVSFTGGGEAVRLESELGVVSVPEPADSGRRRLVLRNLPREADLSVRLGWEGGRSPAQTLRAGSAVLEGAPLLAGEGGLRLGVRRPCALRLPGEDWRSVSPGVLRLERPPGLRSGGLQLEARERGLIFPFAWSREEIARGTFDALLEELAKLDEIRHLRGLVESPDMALQAARADAAKAAFADLYPDLDRLLVRDLPRVRGRALLRALERFQRLAAFERGLSLPGRVPGSGEGRWGERPNGFPPWQDSVRRATSLAPSGSLRPLAPSPVYFLGVKLGHLGGNLAGALRSFRPRNAVTELHGTWPRDAPEAGADMAVGIQVENMIRESQLLLVSHAVDEEPLELRFWHPSPAPVPRPRYTGWLVATLPAEVAPRPGEGFHIELTSLFEQAFRGNEVRQVEVAWRVRGGEP
jgi:hypothetical protein